MLDEIILISEAKLGFATLGDIDILLTLLNKQIKDVTFPNFYPLEISEQHQKQLEIT